MQRSRTSSAVGAGCDGAKASVKAGWKDKANAEGQRQRSRQGEEEGHTRQVGTGIGTHTGNGRKRANGHTKARGWAMAKGPREGSGHRIFNIMKKIKINTRSTDSDSSPEAPHETELIINYQLKIKIKKDNSGYRSPQRLSPRRRGRNN